MALLRISIGEYLRVPLNPNHEPHPPSLQHNLPGLTHQLLENLTNPQVYFILTLYSYAAHLRNSTYHQLPRTARSKASQLAHPNTPGDVQVLHEMQDELEDELAEAEAEAEAEASANGQAAKSQEIRKGSYGASRSTVTSDSIGKGKGKGKQRDEGI